MLTLKFIFFTSMFMMFMKTPMQLTLSLILISLLITSTLPSLMYSSWLSFMIFLMMIGGLMILFMYMVSLSPNTKSPKFSNSKIFWLSLTFLISFIFFPMNIYLPNPSLNSLFSIMSLPANLLFMMFSILYLFLLLFVLSIILSKTQGPLRSL